LPAGAIRRALITPALAVTSQSLGWPAAFANHTSRRAQLPERDFWFPDSD